MIGVVLICIDPGHGGRDLGAISKSEIYQEKNNVISIAKEIKNQENNLPGVNFVYTRLV